MRVEGDRRGEAGDPEPAQRLAPAFVFDPAPEPALCAAPETANAPSRNRATAILLIVSMLILL